MVGYKKWNPHLITRRSEVQVPPPQPYRVDVTDFSYIHLFFVLQSFFGTEPVVHWGQST